MGNGFSSNNSPKTASTARDCPTSHSTTAARTRRTKIESLSKPGSEKTDAIISTINYDVTSASSTTIANEKADTPLPPKKIINGISKSQNSVVSPITLHEKEFHTIFESRGSRKSLRSMAHLHHSRQENLYIPSDRVIPEPRSFFYSHTDNGREVDQSDQLRSSLNILLSKENQAAIEKKWNTSSKLKFEVDGTPPNVNYSPNRFRPNLKIKIQDDVDWIQVTGDTSDADEDDVGLDGSERDRTGLMRSAKSRDRRPSSQTLTGNNLVPSGSDFNSHNKSKEKKGSSRNSKLNSQNSLVFTKSGAIILNGFSNRRISISGIEKDRGTSSVSSKVQGFEKESNSPFMNDSMVRASSSTSSRTALNVNETEAEMRSTNRFNSYGGKSSINLPEGNYSEFNHPRIQMAATGKSNKFQLQSNDRYAPPIDIPGKNLSNKTVTPINNNAFSNTNSDSNVTIDGVVFLEDHCDGDHFTDLLDDEPNTRSPSQLRSVKPNLRINVGIDSNYLPESSHITPLKSKLGTSRRALLPVNKFLSSISADLSSTTNKINSISSSCSTADDRDNTLSPRVKGKLAMGDRMILLCRLGQGASSVVYKALDLQSMQLVAIKMISVHERSKRRQMVQELTTLYKLLRQKDPPDLAALDYNSSISVKSTFSTDSPVTVLSLDTDQKLGTNSKNSSEKKFSDMRKSGNRRSASDAEAMSSICTSPSTVLHKVGHEYIVDFYDAFSALDEGGVGLMIEYMDGGSLQDIVDNGGCDDEASLASIALQGLTGLSFLHSKYHLHRDIKPANFLISKRGEVKIGDFGILRDLNQTSQQSSQQNSCVQSRETALDMKQYARLMSNQHNSQPNSNVQSRETALDMKLYSRLNGIQNSHSSNCAQPTETSVDAKHNSRLTSNRTAYDREEGSELDSSRPRKRSQSTHEKSVKGAGVVNGIGLSGSSKREINSIDPRMSIGTDVSAEEVIRTRQRTSTFVGTVSYMSPERIDGQEYSYPADIWAFGLSLLTVAMGSLMVETSGGYWGVLESIRDSEPPCLPPNDERFSDQFRDFLSKCLQKDPSARSTCKQLLKHTFLKRASIDDIIDTDINVKRGTDELREIVVALHSHLVRMRQRDRQKATVEEGGHEEFLNFFGNVDRDDLSKTAERLLLGSSIPHEAVDKVLKTSQQPTSSYFYTSPVGSALSTQGLDQLSSASSIRNTAQFPQSTPTWQSTQGSPSTISSSAKSPTFISTFTTNVRPSFIKPLNRSPSLQDKLNQLSRNDDANTYLSPMHFNPHDIAYIRDPNSSEQSYSLVEPKESPTYMLSTYSSMSPRRQFLREISKWFSDEVWDDALWNVRNLAYQLHISSEEAVLEILQTCQDIRNNPREYQLCDENGALSTRPRGDSFTVHG